MAEPPDQIDLKRHRDLAGRGRGLWLRRGVIVVFVAIPALALANVFGQHGTTSRAASGTASLTISAPERLRGGLMFQAKFTISAPDGLKDAHLVLSPGWLDGMTVNTIEPSVSDETSANGSLQLSLGAIPPGHVFVLYTQFQVNPTTVAHRSQETTLFDGATRLLTVHRTITVFP